MTKKKLRTYSDMHVLEENKESLPDQLKVPTWQGCVHLEKKKMKHEMKKKKTKYKIIKWNSLNFSLTAFFNYLIWYTNPSVEALL